MLGEPAEDPAPQGQGGYGAPLFMQRRSLWSAALQSGTAITAVHKGAWSRFSSSSRCTSWSTGTSASLLLDTAARVLSAGYEPRSCSPMRRYRDTASTSSDFRTLSSAVWALWMLPGPMSSGAPHDGMNGMSVE